MPDLLLELFSEEIPARMQDAAAQHLRSALAEKLAEAGYAQVEIESFVTPRRLTAWVKNLPAMQADTVAERKGPKTNAPATALEGFLRSTGLTLDQLEKRTVGKDELYFATVQQKGQPTTAVLKTAIEGILAEFPWPKSMRWGSGSTRWVRPLKNILCLFDGKVVAVEFAGLTASNITHGHRFLAPQEAIVLTPAGYVKQLEGFYVLADREERKSEIAKKLQKVAEEKNLTVKPDEGLLEEVTGLVEWPNVLVGSIDAPFMELPPEVLTTVMRSHQKYFALQQSGGALASHFLVVTNMEPRIMEDGGKAIIAGNERVLRARFADGRFFWDQDRLKKLDAWAEGLKSVTFHAKLGTVAQKVERITEWAEKLAAVVPGAEIVPVRRAAQLCKADLVTGMVGEFAELQGVMGRYYALAQGENALVADAIRDHYKPQGPNDSVPTAPVSLCIALADKLDTLGKMFEIGEKPTGSKDPFALRRAALGVIRIILENKLRLPIANNMAQDVTEFFLDRLKVTLREKNIRHDIITAALEAQYEGFAARDLTLLVAYIEALQTQMETEAGKRLVQLAKRVLNILSIEEKKEGKRYEGRLLPDKLLPVEITLLQVTQAAENTMLEEMKGENFTAALTALLTLESPLTTFFDSVMVNDENPAIRENRLNLLAQVRAVLDKAGNFALLEG